MRLVFLTKKRQRFLEQEIFIQVELARFFSEVVRGDDSSYVRQEQLKGHIAEGIFWGLLSPRPWWKRKPKPCKPVACPEFEDVRLDVEEC